MTDPEASDWRLMGQERFLFGATLYPRRYTPPRPGWDHDHCDFCWQKFSPEDAPDVIRDGYVTADGKHWICPTCVHDFRDRFQFQVL